MHVGGKSAFGPCRWDFEILRCSMSSWVQSLLKRFLLFLFILLSVLSLFWTSARKVSLGSIQSGRTKFRAGLCFLAILSFDAVIDAILSLSSSWNDDRREGWAEIEKMRLEMRMTIRDERMMRHGSDFMMIWTMFGTIKIWISWKNHQINEGRMTKRGMKKGTNEWGTHDSSCQDEVESLRILLRTLCDMYFAIPWSIPGVHGVDGEHGGKMFGESCWACIISLFPFTKLHLLFSLSLPKCSKREDS